MILNLKTTNAKHSQFTIIKVQIYDELLIGFSKNSSADIKNITTHKKR